MFQTAATSLTLLSVLFHAAMGCCTHHDHHFPGQAEPSVVEVNESNHCHCRFHTGCRASAETPVSDDDDSCPCGESHFGCDDHCSWLTNSRVEVPGQDRLPLSATAVDLSSLTAACAGILAIGFAANVSLCCDRAGSLRANHQVWQL